MKMDLNDCDIKMLSDIELSDVNGGTIDPINVIGGLLVVWGFCYELGKSGKSADSHKGN